MKINKIRYQFLTFLIIVFITTGISGQSTFETVYVDQQGVMRWKVDNEEIKGFGVNYTMPFAHAYRSTKKLGKDPLDAIDEDVHHFKRLGFDLYRVHVWDTEISDTLGNLIFNEHLHTFDYLLHKLRSRDIYYVLTPIAFWGNGWPEPDQATPGFSAKYGKNDCLTNEEAIKAQENYLEQFMNHVNPYTGMAYKDDPYLIAMEISNEPHHRGSPESVTVFVQKMVEAVRRSGYKNPIFYNVSHSVHLMENYFDADIQGGTFQWYPTGLGYQQPLPGNFLPNVDRYEMPFDSVFKKRGKAKLVYEFDSPDVHETYMYPAMARSFRTAGIQIATHFAYDPLVLAYANTEYNTHYMNLAYTPGKALALAISSKIFHEMPLNENYGSYPENKSFGNVSIDEQKDVVIYDNGREYIYTNNTATPPKKVSSLQKIAGVGNSPVINYDGTGAYFLDYVQDGKWRLEVMPDILTYRNPYGRNSLDKRVTAVQYNDREMKIELPGIGKSFTIKGINSGNEMLSYTKDGKIMVKPGVYLLEKGNTLQNKVYFPSEIDGLSFSAYFAPEASKESLIVHHNPVSQISGNNMHNLSVRVLSDQPIDKVELLYATGWRWNRIEMEQGQGFEYLGKVDLSQVNEGKLRYYFVVYNDHKTMTFPPNKPGLPFQWDFYDRNPYTTQIIPIDAPLILYNAEEDFSELSYRWMQGVRNESNYLPGQMASYFPVSALYRPDPENMKGEKIYQYTIRHFLDGKLDPSTLNDKSTLIIKAKSLEDYEVPVEVSLVDKYGNAYGSIINLKTNFVQFEIKMTDLESVPLVTMPRPYPTFLPFFYKNELQSDFNLEDLQSLQISIGPSLHDEDKEKPQGIALQYIYLQ